MDGFLAATGHLDSAGESVEFSAEGQRPIGEIDPRLAFSTLPTPRRTRAARSVVASDDFAASQQRLSDSGPVMPR